MLLTLTGACILFTQLYREVQQVNAIGPPPEGSLFGHLKNVVVFPAIGKVIFHVVDDVINNTIEGERPIPSMLGGGDLDGDIYAVMQYEPVLSVISWTPAE